VALDVREVVTLCDPLAELQVERVGLVEGKAERVGAVDVDAILEKHELKDWVNEAVCETLAVELTDGERLEVDNAVNVEDTLPQGELVGLRDCVTDTVCVKDTDGLIDCVNDPVCDIVVVELTEGDLDVRGDAVNVADTLPQGELVGLRDCVTDTVCVKDTDGLIDCVNEAVCETECVELIDGERETLADTEYEGWPLPLWDTVALRECVRDTVCEAVFEVLWEWGTDPVRDTVSVKAAESVRVDDAAAEKVAAELLDRELRGLSDCETVTDAEPVNDDAADREIEKVDTRLSE
jgi:hypothetical protein